MENYSVNNDVFTGSPVVYIPRKLGRKNPQFIKTDNFNLAAITDAISNVSNTVNKVSNAVNQVTGTITQVKQATAKGPVTTTYNDQPTYNNGYPVLNTNPYQNAGYPGNLPATGLQISPTMLMIGGSIIVIIILTFVVLKRK